MLKRYVDGNDVELNKYKWQNLFLLTQKGKVYVLDLSEMQILMSQEKTQKYLARNSWWFK